MSLIHKALKKAEGDARSPADPITPEEAMVRAGRGGRGGGGRPRPTTLILLVVALGVGAYTIYRQFFRQARLHSGAVAVPLIPSSLSGAPIAADGADTADAGSGRRPNVHPDNVDLPEKILDLVEEGEAFFADGQFEPALAKFIAAAKVDPERAMLWNNIGLTHKKLGSVVKAEEAYTRALEITPDATKVLNNLGALKMSQRDHLAAALYFRQAIAANAEYAEAHFNLAVLMEEEGNWRSAVTEYMAFLQHAPMADARLREEIALRIEEITP
jgi:tetratricopeptide (TPR) repeat protein